MEEGRRRERSGNANNTTILINGDVNSPISIYIGCKCNKDKPKRFKGIKKNYDEAIEINTQSNKLKLIDLIAKFKRVAKRVIGILLSITL